MLEVINIAKVIVRVRLIVSMALESLCRGVLGFRLVELQLDAVG